MPLSKEDIREIIRTELQGDLDHLQTSLAAQAQSVAAAAKTLERLSLIVAGDEELRVPGLLKDVEDLKIAKQNGTVERAKLGGIWIGVSVVGLAVLRVVWYFIDIWLQK